MILRFGILSVGALIAATAWVDLGIAAETFNSFLSEDGKTLTYTPCAVDEAAECIAYALDCHGDDGSGGNLNITIFGNEQAGPNVRTLAKTLIDRPYGEAKVNFQLAGKAVAMAVIAITVSQDEMNGDWDLDLDSYDQGTLFDALSKASAKTVTLDVAGHRMTLADSAKSADALLRFKTMCAAN